MAEARSEPGLASAGATRVPLPDGWGEAWLEASTAERRMDTVRAATADGLRLSWRPGPANPFAGFGCDAERCGEPPAALARRLGLEGEAFWRAWTVAEACAKAEGTPILAWIGRHGARRVPGFEVHEVQMGDLRLAFARRTT